MKIDVGKVASLANLPLSPEEEEKYSEQLSKILEYVEQLNKVDTEGVEPTFNVTGISNVLRKDEVGPDLIGVGDCTISQEESLQNAPQKKNSLPAGRQGFFVTKGVFEE